MRSIAVIILITVITVRCTNSHKTINLENGSLYSIEKFESKFVDPRRVDIWLPKDYGKNEDERYAVLYMHDGQNLFMSETAFYGKEWRVDEIADSLLQAGTIKPLIIVGIWNTPKRYIEYLPEKPFNLLSDSVANKIVAYQGNPISDEYLKFIVDELKPFIDTRFKTLTDKGNTFMMGSSMGGLISMYAAGEYPEIFGGAGCISTHWPVTLDNTTPQAAAKLAEYVSNTIKSENNQKIYFDFGTATLDSTYEPYQLVVDSMMRKNDFDSWHWVTKKFEGAEHNEVFWRKRLHVPLVFLLGKSDD